MSDVRALSGRLVSIKVVVESTVMKLVNVSVLTLGPSVMTVVPGTPAPAGAVDIELLEELLEELLDAAEEET